MLERSGSSYAEGHSCHAEGRGPEGVTGVSYPHAVGRGDAAEGRRRAAVAVSLLLPLAGQAQSDDPGPTTHRLAYGKCLPGVQAGELWVSHQSAPLVVVEGSVFQALPYVDGGNGGYTFYPLHIGPSGIEYLAETTVYLPACNESDWRDPWNLSVSDGAAVAGAICAVWFAAWAFRAAIKTLRAGDAGQVD